MQKRSALIILALLVVLSSLVVRAAEEHLLPLQGTARINNAVLPVGNLNILIYDAPSGGNLVYNSSSDFHGVIRNGRYDILIGNGSQPLSLRFGTKYYMDIVMNNTDLDFNGSERQVFMSTIGNLSLTTPLSTSSNDTDDALNISDGGSFFGGNISVNGTVNITAASGDIRTAGRITSLNTDTDDAVNLTAGGLVAKGQLSVENYTSGQALTINKGFNVSGTNSDLNTNGTIMIVTPASLPLSVNRGLNVTNSGSLVTNGSITIDTPLGFPLSVNRGFNITNSANLVTNGTIRVENTDTDDAVNLTAGGLVAKGQLSVENYTQVPAFSINKGVNISGSNGVLTTNSTIAIETSRQNAFTVNRGFNITGADNAVRTNGTIKVEFPDVDDAVNLTAGGLVAKGQLSVENYTSGQAFSINKGFNVSGTNSNLVTNGTITSTSIDPDDALNISGASLFKDKVSLSGNLPDPIFTVNNGFNISASDGALRTNGTVTIINSDADDALNVTAAARIGGPFRIGTPGNPTFAVGHAGAGLVTITSNDADDALNITAGGMVIAPGGNALTIDNAGKVTVRTNDADDALNVTSGMVVGSGPGGADQFKIDNNGAVRIQNPDTDDALNITRGAMVVAPGASAFRVGNDGKVAIQSTDTDDALNVSGSLILGVNNPGSQFKIGNLVISDLSVITTQASIAQNGHVVINSLTEPAFRINSGFNVSGTTGALTTNGTITILNTNSKGSFSINNAFNITGDNNNVRTNGTISITNTDTDGALNITGGLSVNTGSIPAAVFKMGVFGFEISEGGAITTQNAIGPSGNVMIRSIEAQALSVNAGFNVSGPSGALKTNGTMTVLNPDTDDAFNVSNDVSGSFFGGNITVGTAESTGFHSVKIFDGGADKCGALILFDESGADYFIYVNATNGMLIISNTSPTTCDEGQVVGRQN